MITLVRAQTLVSSVSCTMNPVWWLHCALKWSCFSRALIVQVHSWAQFTQDAGAKPCAKLRANHLNALVWFTPGSIPATCVNGAMERNWRDYRHNHPVWFQNELKMTILKYNHWVNASTCVVHCFVIEQWYEFTKWALHTYKIYSRHTHTCSFTLFFTVQMLGNAHHRLCHKIAANAYVHQTQIFTITQSWT